jgi:hypothetical protein
LPRSEKGALAQLAGRLSPQGAQMKFRIPTCLGAVVAVALIVAAIVPTSAGALILPGGKKTVTSRDSVVNSKCQLSVKSVNTADFTSTIHVQGSARPSSLSGYSTNVFTEINCYVFDANANFLTQLQQANNGPRVSGSEDVVVPYSPSYTLCIQTYVKLKNGDEDLSPLNCS